MVNIDEFAVKPPSECKTRIRDNTFSGLPNVDFNFDPNADCPKGKEALEKILPDVEIRRTFQYTGRAKFEFADSQSESPRLPIHAALILAHQGMEQITSGKARTMRQIADSLNINRAFIVQTLQLANLAPDIVKMIWENRQPADLTLEKLRRHPGKLGRSTKTLPRRITSKPHPYQFSPAGTRNTYRSDDCYLFAFNTPYSS